MGSSFSSLVSTFREYAEQSVNGLLAIRYTLLKLTTQHMTEGILTGEDVKTFASLEKRKFVFIGEVQAFAATVGSKLRLVQARIRNADRGYLNMEACYGGFNREDTLTKAAELQTACVSLQQDYDAFKRHFQNKYGVKKEKTKRAVEALAFTAVALGCAVVVALHLIPFVNFTLAPAVVMGLGAMGVIGGFVAASRFMTKNEVERAEAFLGDVSTQLGRLKDHLVEVRASTEALTMADRRECADLVGHIIAECDSIVAVCRTMPA